ncbi:hypothetical protein FJT64_024261 [Amphibalanus amphitrite]|uniref:Uncharacterized protein n=1 Tax=Amphibalanus amphitrite TaxID=1232801 RepID=A0A6A4WP93_AMPAM|nr:hypothetical protein FJT64_024261 [Amphibalanus amphitrite]
MSRMEGNIEAPESKRSKLAKYEAALCKLMDAAQQLTGCEGMVLILVIYEFKC